ncbi:PREDICTED: uncharacterized protein LOC108370510 [Rhagoletis zephyria]|uniref:uncharacterized protein LOC108370510 n=1 Tax=Rhagoletis zephyria TaxID=28612 RepID=UPI00081163C4|nr:PREDICTED: uncharacterized protein LOC108370510 [Rhagoletis zephyria]XP_017481326.1 PREDICTED: uncharacterized protein LOC108370510 [Rhagoletis zephyria]
MRKNAHVQAEMAADLAELGYTHSARDVQVKLQNFSQRYRKEKADIGPSGGSPSTWVHYERVHQIIEGFKANVHTELTLESIDEASKASSSTAPLPSPGTPLPSPSSPLPSPVPSTSASAGKTKKYNFQEKLLEKFDNLSSDIAEHLKRSEENEKELIEIENKSSAVFDYAEGFIAYCF